jgi:hypothetical protein
MESTTVTRSKVSVTGGRLGRRAAAACGALFTLGIIVGDDTINGAGEPPVATDPASGSLIAVERYLGNAAEASANGSYWVGRGIGVLALLALLVFSMYVAREIRTRESDSEMLSGLALGAGLVAVSLGLVSCAAQFAAVSRASQGIDVEVARALLDFSGITFVLMWLPVAVFMAASAIGGKRHDLFPPWLTIITAVVAAGLFVGLAAMPASSGGFIAIVLGFLWFVVASLVLARRAT